MKSLLTQDISRVLLLNFAELRGPQGFTEEEAAEVLSWANQTLMDFTLLTLILKGKIAVNVQEGEPFFLLRQPGAVANETVSRSIWEQINGLG